MITDLTKKDLENFEKDILECFENKEIRAPIHLAGGNERQLIEIFKKIRRQDWVCCTWRSHYECLLKGVSQQELKQAILDGYSISLCFKKYKIISSAIVGGICPIALGLAQASKKLKKNEQVYCFIGDMAANTGIFYECWQYSVVFNLPITWIIADNNKAVCTPTNKVWNYLKHPFSQSKEKVIYYHYKPKYVHAGGGKRINF